jgi:hypothetical protein
VGILAIESGDLVDLVIYLASAAGAQSYIVSTWIATSPRRWAHRQSHFDHEIPKA